jgi:hypothetical protein
MYHLRGIRSLRSETGCVLFIWMIKMRRAQFRHAVEPKVRAHVLPDDPPLIVTLSSTPTRCEARPVETDGTARNYLSWRAPWGCVLPAQEELIMNMKKYMVTATACLAIFSSSLLVLHHRTADAATASNSMTEQSGKLTSLLTPTPEEGFALALRLARKGVTETQPDKNILHTLRPHYSRDAESLIAASRVVAVHFQTIAAANDYWRK